MSSLQFVRSMVRALRRGDLFPPAGRVAPQAAPGGSRTEQPSPPAFNELPFVEVTHHHFPVAHLQKPIQILHLTDVHLRGQDAGLDALCAKISALRPDVVVLTGDVITKGWTMAAVDQFLAALPDAPLGRFAVMGNWEYWAGAPDAFWERRLKQDNITLLHNRSVDLGPLQLAGTDDALAGQPDLGAAFGGLRAGHPTVVLTHSPILFEEIARPGVDLVLAGHTHGGQVRLPGLGPVFLPRGSGDYPWGWYNKGQSWLFVGRGLGWSVAPWRWRAPPEIALIFMEAVSRKNP